ncbi:MAG: hydrogenase/urease maturation nickel metallochaperone HypA [Candidatus Limnocylindria bacterium]
MHEVALVADLLDAATRHARGRRVTVVRVRHAAAISAASLQQAFTMLTEDGPMANASLETTALDLDYRCGCGFHGPLGHDDLLGGSMVVCPACGGVGSLGRIAELELLEVRTA